MIVIRKRMYSSLSQQQSPPYQLDPEENINIVEQQRSSKDLQIEQLRLQRQLLETQKLRQRIQAEERMQQLKANRQAQKIEQQKDEQQQDNQIKVKKIESQSNSDKFNNTPLYKTKSKPSPTVSMKTNL